MQIAYLKKKHGFQGDLEKLKCLIEAGLLNKPSSYITDEQNKKRQHISELEKSKKYKEIRDLAIEDGCPEAIDRYGRALSGRVRFPIDLSQVISHEQIAQDIKHLALVKKNFDAQQVYVCGLGNGNAFFEKDPEELKRLA